MLFSRVSLSLMACLMMLAPLRSVKAEGFTFSAISDIPYGHEQNDLLESTIIPALLKSESPFLIHMGDIKGGGVACSDELMKARYEQIMRMHPKYVFFTPGDNDWTDCDREQTDGPVSELMSLDKLRRLFYSKTPSYPNTWQVKQQALYPENKHWIYKNVSFATIHLVGTNNGRAQIDKDNEEFALSQVKARDEANEIWIKSLFEQAEDQKTEAIVIATQADVSRFKYSEKCNSKTPVKCDGFAHFKKHLRNAASNYQKPVLLLHGDTSPYCMDKQFGGENATNLWRFNSAGDYKVLDAVKITVHPKNNEMPFKMESLREGQLPEEHC